MTGAPVGRRAVIVATFDGDELARCRDSQHVDFFPGSGDSPEPARRVCMACEVRVPCLKAALEVPTADDHGVLGGTTAKERRKMRKGSR